MCEMIKWYLIGFKNYLKNEGSMKGEIVWNILNENCSISEWIRQNRRDFTRVYSSLIHNIFLEQNIEFPIK